MSKSLSLILVVFLLGLVAGYGRGNAKHLKLQGMVEQNNSLAKQKLRQLTKERDRKQAEIDKIYKDQEGKDRAAKAEINRLVNELADSRIRVRVEARDCGGDTEDNTASNTSNNNGNRTAANGLLPEKNSRRLGAAIEEIEILSAAYRSCRSALFNLNYE